ncbi:MAG: DUF2017 family protein [Thermoleophilia bacterium]
MLWQHGISRGRSGEVRVRLSDDERALLRFVAAELRGDLEADPAAADLHRLFPPAYPDHDRDEAEYRDLMRGDLLDGRLAALRTFEETVANERLAEEELEVWMRALNDLRLVLGTRLDVQEETLAHGLDERDPRAPELALYGYLSWLQEQVVEAVAGGLSR